MCVKQSNLGTTPPRIVPAKNAPFGGAHAYHMSGYTPHGVVDWTPPREAVMVGIPTYCCCCCCHHRRTKNDYATEPVWSPFVILPHVVVVAVSSIDVFLVLYQSQSQ